MGFSDVFFGDDEDMERLRQQGHEQEQRNQEFGDYIKWALDDGERRERYRSSPPSEEPEPWSVPLRRWAQEREQERSQVPRRERLAKRDPGAIASSEKPSPRMRRRSRVTIEPETPRAEVIAFPSPNREIRAACREQAMIGKCHRVLIDDD
jgi:hypothetical protein